MANGETVWWVASPLGADYYGLTAIDTVEAAASSLSLVASFNASELATRPKPDKVIYSKPDVYDVQKGVGEYLTTHGYQRVETLPAFSVWAAPTESPSP